MQLNSINYRQFDQLDLLARQVVEGFIIGLHKSPYHGFSVEFAEYRSYNSGDSVRSVDWKAYAKTGKMYLKKFEEETNLRCQIIMDISSSMRFPKNLESNQLNKLEFSAVSVAALNYLLKKQRDAIGLTLVSDHVVEHTPAKTNLAHQQLIYNHLYQVLNSKEIATQKTNLPDCIHQVAEMIHKRSLVIIFSDFLENQDKIDELFNAVQHLKHNKHEVVVFHVQSKKEEQDFEFENRPHEFIDMESGKSIKLMPNQIKEIYQEKMSNYLQELKNKFISYRIDWVVANIEDGFNEVLMTYLIKRKKMRA